MRCLSRNSVILVFRFLAIPALLGYRYTPPNPTWANGLVMGIAGFLVGGPAVLISTVVIHELSKCPELRGARTQATVTGVIDGTGSLGACLGQITIRCIPIRLVIRLLSVHHLHGTLLYLHTATVDRRSPLEMTVTNPSCL